jgi:hypothetical protein
LSASSSVSAVLSLARSTSLKPAFLTPSNTHPLQSMHVNRFPFLSTTEGSYKKGTPVCYGLDHGSRFRSARNTQIPRIRQHTMPDHRMQAATTATSSPRRRSTHSISSRRQGSIAPANIRTQEPVSSVSSRRPSSSSIGCQASECLWLFIVEIGPKCRPGCWSISAKPFRFEDDDFYNQIKDFDLKDLLQASFRQSRHAEAAHHLIRLGNQCKRVCDIYWDDRKTDYEREQAVLQLNDYIGIRFQIFIPQGPHQKACRLVYINDSSPADRQGDAAAVNRPVSRRNSSSSIATLDKRGSGYIPAWDYRRRSVILEDSRRLRASANQRV